MDDFDYKIDIIKKYRSPDYFLDNIILNLKYRQNIDYFHYWFNNKVVFEYDAIYQYFYLEFNIIYLPLKERFHLSDAEIKRIIINKCVKYKKHIFPFNILKIVVFKIGNENGYRYDFAI